MNSHGQLIRFIISNTSTASGLTKQTDFIRTDKDEVIKHIDKTEVIKETYDRIHQESRRSAAATAIRRNVITCINRKY
jgi:hypothetical protein